MSWRASTTRMACAPRFTPRTTRFLPRLVLIRFAAIVYIRAYLCAHRVSPLQFRRPPLAPLEIESPSTGHHSFTGFPPSLLRLSVFVASRDVSHLRPCSPCSWLVADLTPDSDSSCETEFPDRSPFVRSDFVNTA